MREFEEYLKQLRASLGLTRRRADEVCDEVCSHLEARAAQFEQTGMTREEAVEAAVRSFGKPEAMARKIGRANGPYKPLFVVAAVTLGAGLGSVAFPLVVLLTTMLTHLRVVNMHFFIRDLPIVIIVGAAGGALVGLLSAAWRVRGIWIGLAITVADTILFAAPSPVLLLQRGLVENLSSYWRNGGTDITLGHVCLVPLVGLAVNRWLAGGRRGAASDRPKRASIHRHAR